MNTCKAKSLLAHSASPAIVFCLVASLAVSAVAQNTTVRGNTPGFVQKAKDLGPTDPNTVITVSAWLRLHNEAQLDKLVQQQNQKGSPNYHKWISQAQFDASFGPTAQELKAVQNFLNAHGLTTIDVAQNNAYVKVQGTVDAVQKAFHVQIDNFSFQGQTYRSNKNDPSVGGASGGQSFLPPQPGHAHLRAAAPCASDRVPDARHIAAAGPRRVGARPVQEGGQPADQSAGHGERAALCQPADPRCHNTVGLQPGEH